ncbi:MAG: hypothetical protein Q7V05_05490 [Methanoregula sp.]|nr:hypothetical protein [Methanoregula sp.]
MIPEKEEQDRVEAFFQILLIGELFTQPLQEDLKKYLGEILRKCGITLNSSDFMILDYSQIGNSTITIARYTLDYVHDGDATGKRVCIEGSVAMETDDLGNRQIRISSKTDPFMLNFDTPHSEASLISGKI